MKKIYVAFASLLAGTMLHSQCTVQVTGSTPVTCFGACNGSASLATVGVPNYSYLWMPGGQTVQNPTNLCAGTHTVTMTDANSCVATATVTITQPTDIQVVNGVQNVTCNGACDGKAGLVVTGGTPGYTFSWAPSGGTNDTITAACPGTYTATITDNNGCVKTSTATITQPNALTVSVSSTNVHCNGACDGATNATPLGGTAPYNYAWVPGGQNTSLCPGMYTVTVTDANGCTVMDSAMITEPTLLNVTTSNSNEPCNGTCNAWAAASPSGGSPGYTWMWSPSSQTSDTATQLCAGAYTVTVTDANQCTAMASVTITEPTALVVSASGVDASAPGAMDGQATAAVGGGTGPYTFAWSPGNQTTQTATGLGAGTYSVTVTDSAGCTMTASVTILDGTGISDPAHALGVSIYPNPVLQNVNIEIKASGEVTYTLYDVTGKMIRTESYTSNNGSTKTISLSNQPSGIYFMQVEMNGQKITQKIIKY